MAEHRKKIVVVATPTSPVLSHLLYALSRQRDLQIVVLTRETSIEISTINRHSHNHTHDHNHNHESEHKHEKRHPKITHIQTSFDASELDTHLANTETVICTLTGSDIHLTPSIIDASTKAQVKLFIPSEYGLDTSNAKIRELLLPYQTRFEIQQKLKKSRMSWTAIYSGIVLEDALKTDGVLGIDALWASVVVFPHRKETKIVVSTYDDIAKGIVEVMGKGEKNEESGNYMCSFQATLDEIVAVVEEEIEKPLDRYEGVYEGAKKEAAERMKMGFFDGGVALLGRVAVWNDEVDAWSGWKSDVVGMQSSWQAEVKKVTQMVKDGDIGGGGCSC